MKKTKNIFFFTKALIIAFLNIFILTIIFSYCIFLYSYFNTIHISNISTLKIIKKIINRNDTILFDFNSIQINKSDFKSQKMNILIQDVIIKNKHSSLSIINVGDIQVKFNIFDLLKINNYELYIQNIKNKAINIPTNYQKNNYKPKAKTTSIDKQIENISKSLVFAISKYKSLLSNSININNTTIKLLDINNNKKITTLNIVHSYLQVVQADQLSKEQKNILNHILTTNEKKNRNLIKKLTDIFHQQMAYKFKDVLVNQTTLEYNKHNIEINTLCTFDKHALLDKCLILVNNLTMELKNHKIFNIDLEKGLLSANGNILLELNKNGIKQLKADISTTNIVLTQLKKETKIFGNITTKVDIENNMRNINNISIECKNNKQKQYSITAKDIIFKNNHLNGGDVELKIINFKLSNFFSFLQNHNVNLTKNIWNVNGIVDGNLYFTFDKNGKLIPKKSNNSKIKLKKIIINTRTYNYNLSGLEFYIETLNNKIIFKSASKTNQNNYFTLTYNSSQHKSIIINIHDLIIDKQSFNEFKRFFLDKTQFNILKNIEIALKNNGYIEIPLTKKDFVKNLTIKLKIDVLSADKEDLADDEIFFTLTKEKGKLNGTSTIDFGKSKMYSKFYGFEKKETDKSVITTQIKFKEFNKDLSFKIDSAWKLNENNKAKIHFYRQNNKINIGLNSNVSNLEIVEKQKDDFQVDCYGVNVNFDYEWWHIILFLFTQIKGIVQINVNVPYGYIQDVRFDNFYSHFKLINNKYWYGHFNWLYAYKKEKGDTKVHFSNEKNNKYELYIENILPLLTLYDIDISKIPFNWVKIEGTGDDFIKEEQMNGNLNITFNNKDNGAFNFKNIESVLINDLYYKSNGDFYLKDIHLKGKWFIGEGEFISNKDNVSLEGIFRILTPVKTWFKSKKLNQKNDNIIIKKGNNFEEFKKHMTINGQDFSADKDGKIHYDQGDIIKVLKL